MTRPTSGGARSLGPAAREHFALVSIPLHNSSQIVLFFYFNDLRKYSKIYVPGEYIRAELHWDAQSHSLQWISEPQVSARSL